MAVKMVEKVGVDPSMPRVTKRQKHRSAVEAKTCYEQYETNLTIPLLDYIISDFGERFSKLSVTASSLLGIVPAVILGDKEVNLKGAIDTYNSDLPSLEPVPLELMRWRRKYSRIPTEDRPASPAAAIKEFDPNQFPNIRILLQIASTLPVTSCECKRSASVMRRLHTCTRASMTQERLTFRALLHIHYDKEVNLERVVKLFSKDTRRMQLDSLITQN